MTVYFYTCSDDYRTLNKTLTFQYRSTQVYFRKHGDLNLKNPSIVVGMSSVITTYPPNKNVQIFYIEETKRYFYITNITSLTNGTFEYTGVIDYLTTWKNSILASTVTANHSTSAGNAFLPDTIPVQCKKIINYKSFSGASSSTISAWGSDNVTNSTKSVLLTCM